MSLGIKNIGLSPVGDLKCCRFIRKRNLCSMFNFSLLKPPEVSYKISWFGLRVEGFKAGNTGCELQISSLRSVSPAGWQQGPQVRSTSETLLQRSAHVFFPTSLSDLTFPTSHLPNFSPSIFYPSAFRFPAYFR